MKRIKKENLYPIVKQIRPFFWKECRFCQREFKKEIGYEIEDLTAVNPSIFWSYCCNECANSIEDVLKLVDSKKLKLPPPPPKNGSSINS